MDDKQREWMNRKLDILFAQIDEISAENQLKALAAMAQWKSAKTCESMGLGPMEARHEYKKAYSALKDLGLEVGGMIPPYESPNAIQEAA